MSVHVFKTDLPCHDSVTALELGSVVAGNCSVSILARPESHLDVTAVFRSEWPREDKLFLVQFTNSTEEHLQLGAKVGNLYSCCS